MPVVDAGVLAATLADPSAAGRMAREHLSGAELHAPALIDIEVASTLRGLTRAGKLDAAVAAQALADLAVLPIQRAPHPPLLARIWQLRENLTSYDAAYVALAELLSEPLVTADARLSRAPGLRCEVVVLGIGT